MGKVPKHGKNNPSNFNLIVIWLRCYVKWAVSGMRKWSSEIDMLISVGRHTCWRLRRRRTVGPKCKNSPKYPVKKIVKLTDQMDAYNNLTNFEYEVNVRTRNGNYGNLQKLAWKKSWNHFRWTYFWRIWAMLKPLCWSVT